MKTDNFPAHGRHQSLVILLSLSSSELLGQSNWFFGYDTNLKTISLTLCELGAGK